MEPVNVFLGFGLVLVLAALLGQIEALSVKLPPLGNPRRRLIVGALGLGMIAVAYVAPLPGDSAKQEREAIATYQAQVLSTCDRLGEIRASGDGALHADFDSNGEPVFRRSQMLGLLRTQLSERDAALNALWAIDAPDSLEDERDTARAISDEGHRLATRALVHLSQMPATLHQADFDRFSQRVTAEDPGFSSRMNAAFSALAGQTCQASR